MIDTIIQKYRNWKKYRQTFAELSRLSERELDDVGIGRGDIHFISRGSAR